MSFQIGDRVKVVNRDLMRFGQIGEVVSDRPAYSDYRVRFEDGTGYYYERELVGVISERFAPGDDVLWGNVGLPYKFVYKHPCRDGESVIESPRTPQVESCDSSRGKYRTAFVVQTANLKPYRSPLDDKLAEFADIHHAAWTDPKLTSAEYQSAVVGLYLDALEATDADD